MGWRACDAKPRLFWLSFYSYRPILYYPVQLFYYAILSSLKWSPLVLLGKKVSQKGLIYTLERSKNYMEAKAILVAWRIHVLLFLILASNIYRQPQKYSQYIYFGWRLLAIRKPDIFTSSVFFSWNIFLSPRERTIPMYVWSRCRRVFRH